MKKILIATLLIGMMSGCSNNNKIEKPYVDHNNLPIGVGKFDYEGHSYLWINAGLLHCESCKCKGGNK